MVMSMALVMAGCGNKSTVSTQEPVTLYLIENILKVVEMKTIERDGDAEWEYILTRAMRALHRPETV